ncbi:hypothetical protein RJ641_021954 [Dillenia turbinata]|uniref:Uncharacterized protein n=1 Tax=Dillenia turbinata TaxID=194707 RepID=A0AAN8U8P4_9MAGN
MAFLWPSVDGPYVIRFLPSNNYSQNTAPNGCHFKWEGQAPEWGRTRQELNMQLTQILNQLEAEKKRGEALNEMVKASIGQRWWEAPVEELSVQELEQLNASLQELKKNVTKQAEKLLIESTNSSSPFMQVNGINGVGMAVNNQFETKPNLINLAARSIPQGFAGFSHGHGLF